jgi:hypothetical protein
MGVGAEMRRRLCFRRGREDSRIEQRLPALRDYPSGAPVPFLR